MRKPAIVLLVLAVAASGVSISAGATRAKPPSPKATLAALLSKGFPNSQLPKGFTSAKVTRFDPSSNATTHHVVGEIDVALHGPDPEDIIEYAVFATVADATADLKSQAQTSGGSQFKDVGRVPGYVPFSLWLNGSVTGNNGSGKTVTEGLTILSVQEQNVVVAVLSSSTSDKTRGNVPATRQMLAAAVKHLALITS